MAVNMKTPGVTLKGTAGCSLKFNSTETFNGAASQSCTCVYDESFVKSNGALLESVSKALEEESKIQQENKIQAESNKKNYEEYKQQSEKKFEEKYGGETPLIANKKRPTAKHSHAGGKKALKVVTVKEQVEPIEKPKRYVPVGGQRMIENNASLLAILAKRRGN